jgi:hypothetical protein
MCMALSALFGCGRSQPEPDPQIKAERQIEYPGGDGHIGNKFVGADLKYDHGSKKEKYEGPASKAPDWARPTSPTPPTTPTPSPAPPSPKKK